MQDPIEELEAIRRACVVYFGEYASKMILSKPKADIRLRVQRNSFPVSAIGFPVHMCVIQRGSIEFDGERKPATFIVVMDENKITAIRDIDHFIEILKAEFYISAVKKVCDGVSLPAEKDFMYYAQRSARVIFSAAEREFKADMGQYTEYTSLDGNARAEFISSMIKYVYGGHFDTPEAEKAGGVSMGQEWVALDRLSTILSTMTHINETH